MTGTSSHAVAGAGPAAAPGGGAARVAAVTLLFAGAADLAFLNTWVFPRLIEGDTRGMVNVARVDQVTVLPQWTSRQKAEAVPGQPVPTEVPKAAPVAVAATLPAPPPPATAPGSIGLDAPAKIHEPELRRLRQVFFARNMHDLDTVADQALVNLARKAVGEHATVVIDGHADQTGSEAFNGWLSERRAARVADRFVALGVPRDRIVIRHFGSARPAVTGDHPQAMRRNRRVEIALAEGVIP
jgi:outer membrane protein OmpA-like peptidoglycan-associated protein